MHLGHCEVILQPYADAPFHTTQILAFFLLILLMSRLANQSRD
jgi:hypothetical protein